MKNSKTLLQFKYRSLWLTQHFFGLHKKINPIRKNTAEKIAQLYSLENKPKLIPVPELNEENWYRFEEEFRKTSTPVIFKNGAKNWSAIKKWSPDFFGSNYGTDPVVTYDATVENREAKTMDKTKVSTLSDFVTKMKNGSPDYARFSPLLDEHPELHADFDFNWLRSKMNKTGTDIKTQLFIGGNNTSTSIHSALGSNLFVQVYGKKKWYIYASKYSPLLAPIADRSIFFRSKMDAENPEQEFAQASGWQVTLEPGDILYNPPFYWHQTRNIGLTIGVGFRWFSVSNMIKSSITQLILTLTASNPSISQAKKLQGNFNKVYEQALNSVAND